MNKEEEKSCNQGESTSPKKKKAKQNTVSSQFTEKHPATIDSIFHLHVQVQSVKTRKLQICILFKGK